jgi:hypothetical protein
MVPFTGDNIYCTVQANFSELDEFFDWIQFLNETEAGGILTIPASLYTV